MEKMHECPIGEWNLVVSYQGNNNDEISDTVVHWVGVIPCEEFYVDEALRKEISVFRGMGMSKLKPVYLTSVVASKDLWDEKGEIKGNDDVMLSSTNTVTND